MYSLRCRRDIYTYGLVKNRAILGLFVLLYVIGIAQAQEQKTKILFDPAAPTAHKEITLNDGSEPDVKFSIGNSGIDVTVEPNSKTSFPGIKITPAAAWNASGFGHMEVKVTNTGTKPIRVNLRIDNDGPPQENRSSCSLVSVKPGASAMLTTVFGFQYGKPTTTFKPDAIARALVFTAKSDVKQSFHLDAIYAAGPAGEIPFIDPNNVANKPAAGILLGSNIMLDATRQLIAKNGAEVTATSGGKSCKIDFAAGKEQSVLIKPAVGLWNLRDFLQVSVRVKNVGTTATTASMQLQSKGGATDTITSAPIAPGAEALVVIPFAAKVPWNGPNDPQIQVLELKKDWHGQPNTGTAFTSNTTTALALLSDKSETAKCFEITSVVAQMPQPASLPEWLGKRPPVEGEWTKTFEDNFDGSTIDLNKWNIYTEGDWHLGAATHYSKDNVVLNDGKLALRVEKKYGHHNDDPARPANDYATGYCDTYGKWVQRYGYFEARMKLPTAPNMFYAFWLMPDRGLQAGPQYVRAETKKGGMEFDIMEGLSIWGANRHDCGMHWDGYVKYHKSTGSNGIYVQPDKEGFITVGLLWTPGLMVIYDNGVETARWENPRISNVPSYIILDNITGGWETEAMDDKQLPADLVFDYVRVWQRKDLASEVDGPKPNNGEPTPPKLPAK